MTFHAQSVSLGTPPFEVIATGLRFPEGPVWMPDGSIVLVEIEARRLTRVGADGRVDTIAQMAGGPNGAALGPDGRFCIANNGGFAWAENEHGLFPSNFFPADYSGGRIERVDPATGAIEVLYTECNGRALRGPNDLVLDVRGDFYFTDLGKRAEDRVERGAVYFARGDGSAIMPVAAPTFTANGCALSPDGRVLYYVETESARLWAVDLNEDGTTTHAPFPSPNGARFVAQCGGAFQRFDSIAVDAEGNVCVATLMNGGITIISPDAASVRHLPLPDPMVTNLCFGGPDLGTAYVTLSASGRLIRFDWKRAVGTVGLKLN